MADTRQDHWTTRPIVRGLSAFHLSLAFFAVVAGTLILAAVFGGGGATQHYAVKVTGSLPRIQTVGQSVDATVDVQNLRASTPHVIIDIGGCTDHWVLDGVTVSGVETAPLSGAYYDVGMLPAHSMAHIALSLVPSSAGNHVCEFHVWNGPLSSGVPQGDELADVATTVAVNP